MLVGLLCLPGSLRAATLTGSFASLPVSARVNLSAEGTLDWGHWGLVNEWTYNHKYGMPQQITFSIITDEFATDGPFLLETGESDFSWNDGTPSRLTASTTNGVSVFGDKLPGNVWTGFRLQCPADAGLRRLKLYVGTSGAEATLRASLSGAPAYSDTTFNGATGPAEGVYQLSFQANSPGQILTVYFESGDPTGYIFLKAATLEGPNTPPQVAVTTPADGSVLVAPGLLSVTAAALDGDGVVSNLMLWNGASLLGQAPTGTLTVTLTNPPANAYRLVAVATDNLGLSITSFPANVFVTTGGGTLVGGVSTNTPPNVNLSTEGTSDWAHWGLRSYDSFNRKVSANPRIPNLQVLNASAIDLNQYYGNYTAFSWDDGAPETQAADSSTGVFLYGTNDPPAGFQIAVPATNQLYQLKLYAGLFCATGRLEAWMSDWSAPPYFDSTLSRAYENGWAVYTLRFSSPNPGALLNLTWIPVALHEPKFGNLTWQAITLKEEPPPPLLTVVTPPATNQFAFTFRAEPGLNYQVLFAGELCSPSWQSLTNFTGAGEMVLAVDPAIDGSQRFYKVAVE